MTFFMCGYTFDIVRTMKEGVVMTEPLYLHPAWERTLSQRDLDAIKKRVKGGVTKLFTVLWVATNHRNDLLMTVLIRNETNETLALSNAPMELMNEEQKLCSDLFTFHVPPNCVMPWTLIFEGAACYSSQWTHVKMA